MTDVHRKILLVDNSKTFQSLFKTALSENGCCEVHVCNNGKEALQLIGNQYIDFICSAYYLQDMEGIELCQRVRQLTLFSSKPFVLLTSMENAFALSKALPAGVTDIFHKNDVDQLLAFIKRFPSRSARLNGHVLYVEDSSSQRVLLKNILEHQGLTVDAFASAGEAWQHFQLRNYDLVLTDIVLDGTMSGLSFVNLIRRQVGEKGDTPILALTAFDDKTRRLELFNLGVTDYILKPVAEEELFVRMKGLLAMRRIARKKEFIRQQHHAAELNQSEHRFRTLFENMTEGMALHEMVFDANGQASDYRIIEVNPAFATHTGLVTAQVVGKLATDAYGTSEAPFLDLYAEVARTARSIQFEPYIASLDRHFRIRAYAAEEGRVATVFENITERVKSEEKTRIMATVFSGSNEAILITDADNRIITVNAAFTRLTGYLPEDVFGRDPHLLSAGSTLPETYRQMWASLDSYGAWEGELLDRRKSGEIYPKWLSISVVRDTNGKLMNYIGSFVDISERKATEDRVRYLAHHDPLTDLPNRYNLHIWLNQALALNERNECRLALLLIDLDHFKTINDSLGHPVGDQLLIQVAQRLKQCVRQSDFVARLGGDEFVVVLSGIEAPSDAAQVAGKILSTISKPYQAGNNELRTSPSIGICLCPDDARENETLIKKADMAMYSAKAQGRGNYQFFTESMQQAAIKRLATEEDLRLACARNEFELHYQPQMNLRTNQMTGVEALVRWRHPTRGLLSPVEFIPIAEETGLIHPVGNWVLREACQQLADWHQRGLDQLHMSINLSASQFLDPQLFTRIRETLAETKLAGHWLDLEITESMAMESPDETIAVMKELKAHGLTLSIDDFGTGYSSLAYLKLFPINTLKIDRSFVKDIETDPNDRDICYVTVLLAHKLGLNVVAEGVESATQLDYLTRIGCETAQGFLISKPLPALAVEEFMRNRPQDSSQKSGAPEQATDH